MPDITYISPSGERRTVQAEAGTNLMTAALNNLVPGIVGECGGQMSCATCHVYVDQEWADRLAPITDDEQDMLEATAAEPTKYSRLSCQLICSAETDGVVVHLPEVQ